MIFQQYKYNVLFQLGYLSGSGVFTDLLSKDVVQAESLSELRALNVKRWNLDVEHTFYKAVVAIDGIALVPCGGFSFVDYVQYDGKLQNINIVKQLIKENK